MSGASKHIRAMWHVSSLLCIFLCLVTLISVARCEGSESKEVVIDSLSSTISPTTLWETGRHSNDKVRDSSPQDKSLPKTRISPTQANNLNTNTELSIYEEQDEKLETITVTSNKPRNSNSGETGNKNEKRSRSDEDELDEDYEESEEESETTVEDLAESVCTAEFFLNKIIPEDYPYDISKDVKHINETVERLNRMYNFSTQMMEKLNPFFREMMSRISDYLYESQLEPECMGALYRVFTAASDRKPWALSFFDSSGSFFSGGFQQGLFVSLGEFDQCLEIESESDGIRAPILGQYCLLKPVIPVPEETSIRRGETIAKSKIATVNRFLNDEYLETYLGLYKFIKSTFLRVGICVPHKCDPESLENAINRIMVRKTGLSVRVGPECVKATDGPQFNFYLIVAITIFLILFGLIVASTVYEVVYRTLLENLHPPSNMSSSGSSKSSKSVEHKPKRLQRQVSRSYMEQPIMVQFLTSFSIVRNTRALFEMPSKPRNLPLDTTRLMLALFFFVTNAYCYTLVYAPMIVKRFYVLGPRQFATEKKYFFIRMYYMVDVFVTLSGIALALKFRRQKFCFMRYIGRTYICYTLPILVTIGIIYIVPMLGSGPLWHIFDQTMTQPCKDNILPTLLFYNNFKGNLEEICNLPTVFVSLIFQLKMIAPFVLMLASLFKPKFATIFLLIVTLLSTSINALTRLYFKKLIPYEFLSMKSFSEIKDSFMFYTFNPITHIAPLMMGLLVGHFIKHRMVDRESFRIIVLSGIISTICFFICFFYMESIDVLNPVLSIRSVVSVITMGRMMLMPIFCWTIYACVKGHITIVNRFMCSIVFRPLSQLCYGFFITSIIVTCFRLFSIRQTIILSAQTMFRAIVSDAVVSFILAYFIHLMVQQPLKNLAHISSLRKCFFSEASQNTINLRSISTDNPGNFLNGSQPNKEHLTNFTSHLACDNLLKKQNNLVRFEMHELPTDNNNNQAKT